MNNATRIENEEQLNKVLSAVEEYWRWNATNNKGKSITVSQLLTGAVGVCTAELKEVEE